MACATSAYAEKGEAHVAVASNFARAMEIITADFQRKTGARINLNSASSGLLFAQIAGGEEFDLFLSADKSFPLELEKLGMAEPGTRFTYAIGRLALFGARKGDVDPKGRILEKGGFKKLALGAPAMAPYGRAAMQTLESLKLMENIQGRIVTTGSEEQAFWMVTSGGADLAFVALSRVMGEKGAKGSYWTVPENLHQPIIQQAVLLKKSAGNKTARELLEYLRSPAALAVMSSMGYGAPPAAEASSVAKH